MSFDDAVRELGRAMAADMTAFEAALAEMRLTLGVPDTEVPAYLPRALAALAAGLAPAEEISPEQRGAAWLLRDLAPLLAGELIDESDRDGLFVPALGRALIIERGDERWSVIVWPPASAQPQSRILDTFSPSLDQVRAWAEDPDLRFAEQDEWLAIADPAYLETLVQLAADVTVPKREHILSILDRIVALPGPDRLALLERARDLARATRDPALAAWADQLDRVLAYAHGRGPIGAEVARAIAHDLMIGRRRRGYVLDESRVEGWWVFQARYPGRVGPPIDALQVHDATGAVVFSRWPLSIDELAPHERAPSRLAALAMHAGG